MQADFHIDQHAELVNKLMLKLGYEQYGRTSEVNETLSRPLYN